MKQAFTEEHLDSLRAIAQMVPCRMCRIKGGDNISLAGQCRHVSNLSPGEVVDRLGYAVNQSDTARDLVKATRQYLKLIDERDAKAVVDAIKTWEEHEQGPGVV